MIEIDRRWLLALAIVALLTAACLLGWRSTPRVKGRPVLMTRGNLAIVRYLRAAERWERRLGDVLDAARTLLPAKKGDGGHPLPTPVPPLPAGDLLSRSRRAEQLLQEAVEIRRDMETYPCPEAMKGLHNLAVKSATAVMEAMDALVTSIGMGAATDVTGKFQEAEQMFQTFKSTLARQLEALGGERH